MIKEFFKRLLRDVKQEDVKKFDEILIHILKCCN